MVLALPLFVALRVLDTTARGLRQAAAGQQHAPWLVANLHLDKPAARPPRRARPAWDSVAYGSRMLGYVDAMHQSLRPDPGATVLTAYHALRAGRARRRC